jgi:hypothetical protein
MIKKITYALAVILVVIQFIPMNNEEVNSNEFEISKNFEVPDHVATLLQGACNNCHSNTTTYPWYAELQPVGFWLKHHVDEGKEHLNFSPLTRPKSQI